MNLEEEIKDLKKRGLNNPASPSKMASILAATLDQAATGWAFKIYWDKKFLKLAEIDKLEQVEKDRIFNELFLAGICMIMLTLEARDLRQEEDFKDYLLKVRDEIVSAHINQLKDMGVEKEHQKLWKRLINMRYEEYEKDKLTAREAMMEFEAKENGRSLETEDLEGINLTLVPFTVAVGAHKHIVRGKTKDQDLLFKLIMKLIMKKLSRFYVEIRIMIEGRKITPVLRARIKLHHFWNDLKEDFQKT